MSDDSLSPVTCPRCGKTYRWRDEFAGKQLWCRCGSAFFAPARSSPTATDPAGPAAPRPSALLTAGRSPVEQALARREDEVQPSRVRNVLLPTIILPVGAVAQFVLWTNLLGDARTGALAFAAALAVQLVILLPALLAAVTTTARWFDLALGNLLNVLLKLLALTVGLAGVGDVLFTHIMIATDFDYWSLVAGYGIYLVLAGLPAMILLEFQIHETALVVLMLFLPRVAAVYLLAMTQ